MESNLEQIKKESELLLLLYDLCPECELWLGIEEKYVIASRLFIGKFALSRIVDCNHIHQVIKESGMNCLNPKEAYMRFVEKGWIDND